MKFYVKDPFYEMEFCEREPQFLPAVTSGLSLKIVITVRYLLKKN